MSSFYMSHFQQKYTYLIALVLVANISLAKSIFDVQFDHADKQITNISVSITIPEKDFLYSDYLKITTDNRYISLGEWQPSSKPLSRYDNTFKAIKPILVGSFKINCIASTSDVRSDQDSHLHISYYQQSQGKFAKESFAIPSRKTTEHVPVDTPDSTTTPIKPVLSNSLNAQCHMPQELAKKPFSLSRFVYSLFQATTSVPFRILLSFILGLLLSLTPCIYPMIPITIGIMQAQKSSSLWHNFLLSLSYALGISSTFATLGLFAAFTGTIFGSFMTNPLIVLPIVAFLLYMAFSMLGFYEMYQPSFLQQVNSSVKRGSIISIFFFGAASGTVASPCLSPGLALLLALVSTLNSYLLGFLFLFSFGMGLSLPLLIIGTFSGTINFLPKAGAWMVEIKKLFGLIMIAICFYFLKNLMTWSLFMWLSVAATIATGILEFFVATYSQGIWRTVHNVIGAILICVGFSLAVKTYHDEYYCNSSTLAKKINWLEDYKQAMQQALLADKPIFVYMTASYCTLCTAIERCLLHHPEVLEALSHYVPLKLDACSDKPEISDLKQRYSISGVPTYLIIRPQDGSLINRFGSEIYDDGPHVFAGIIGRLD